MRIETRKREVFMICIRQVIVVLLAEICATTLISPAAGLAAQERIVVDPTPSCAACAIRLERIAVLGGTEIPGALGVHSTIFAGLDGRYYVIDAEVASGQILIYDGSGRYRSSFGRLGQGPGEYQLPQAIIPRSPDTIQVMDSHLRRLTTFTGDQQVVRTQALPLHFTEHVLLPDGGLIVNGQLGTRDAIGFPLHWLDREMRVVHSFGSETPMELPGLGYRNVRQLATAGGSRFWAAHLDRFVVELWDAAGTHIRDYVREVDWFRPWQGMGTLARLTPPQSRIHAVQQDDAGRLWVLLHVAARDWKPGPAPPPRTSTPLANNNLYFDTIVEIWDLGANRILTSARFEQRLHGFLNDQVVYTAREDAQGNPYYDVWRLHPTPTQGGRR